MNEWMKKQGANKHSKNEQFHARPLFSSHLSFEVMIAGPKAMSSMLSDAFCLKNPESVESVEFWRICRGQPPWPPALLRRQLLSAESLSGDVYVTCDILWHHFGRNCVRPKSLACRTATALAEKNSARDLLLQLLRLEELAVQPCWWWVTGVCGRFSKNGWMRTKVLRCTEKSLPINLCYIWNLFISLR